MDIQLLNILWSGISSDFDGARPRRRVYDLIKFFEVQAGRRAIYGCQSCSLLCQPSVGNFWKRLLMMHLVHGDITLMDQLNTQHKREFVAE